MYLSFSVGKKRKQVKIDYPQSLYFFPVGLCFHLKQYVVYATLEQEKENREYLVFNCYQRAHQHFLELVPFTLMFLFVGGLSYPVLTDRNGRDDMNNI
jgi:uncharacterized membrane protein YecN with MAPEG domain